MATVVPGTARADPCVAPLPKAGEHFAGTVRYVGDGDSLSVGVSPQPTSWIEVRVSDFYAAELNAVGGREAKAKLSEMTLGKRLSCVAVKRSYDRVVATCALDGRPLGDLLRRAGVPEGGNR
jgi:endonuclease YncB( thermonuclease family)